MMIENTIQPYIKAMSVRDPHCDDVIGIALRRHIAPPRLQFWPAQRASIACPRFGRRCAREGSVCPHRGRGLHDRARGCSGTAGRRAENVRVLRRPQEEKFRERQTEDVDSANREKTSYFPSTASSWNGTSTAARRSGRGARGERLGGRADARRLWNHARQHRPLPGRRCLHHRLLGQERRRLVGTARRSADARSRSRLGVESRTLITARHSQSHTSISRTLRSCVERLKSISIARLPPSMSVNTISNEKSGAPVSTIVLNTPPVSTMLERSLLKFAC